MINPEFNKARSIMLDELDKVQQAIHNLFIAVRDCENLGLSVRPTIHNDLQNMIVDFEYPPSDYDDTF